MANTLTLIPSGYKSDGTVYSQVPNTADGDFSLSGGTNATRVNSSSQVESVANGTPRLDYLSGSCPTLFVEGSATNLITDSESGVYESSPSSEINETSPANDNTAIRPVPSGGSNRYKGEISGGTFNSGDNVVYSWYRKRISTPVDDSFLGDLDPNASLNATEVGSVTQIESDINGYDRFQQVFEITDGSVATTLRLYFGGIIGIGNSSVAYWGHQLEAGSVATSYIPTSGATQTRGAEKLSNANLSFTNDGSEGTLFIDVPYIKGLDVHNNFSFTDDTKDYEIWIRFSSNGELYHRTFSGASTISGGSGTGLSAGQDFTQQHKLAITWSSTGTSFYVNGLQVYADSTDTSSAKPLSIFKTAKPDDSSPLNGAINSIKIYNTALSQAEAESLTS